MPPAFPSRPFKRLLAGLACLLLLGCAFGARQNPFSEDDVGASELEVTIRNESPRARDVYAYWEGRQREWLGVVSAETTQTFTLTYRSGGIWLSGGPRVFVSVYPGDRVLMVYPRAGSALPPMRR